jgi:Zn-dependent peptidase ImmA (M78 family)
VGTRWERLAGDTSTFAIKLAFSDDPDRGEAATPEETVSWGSLQIWVDDANICAHHSQGELIESVHWYLLPIVEWIVSNWDPLLHEERVPNRNSAPNAQEALFRNREAPYTLSTQLAESWEEDWFAWWSRHSWEAARTGGVLPSFCIRRWRDQIELSWDDRYGPAVPPDVVFAKPAGVARLSIPSVVDPLYSVLKEAVDHLLAIFPESPRLLALRADIATLDRPREQRVAWLIGLGRNIAEMADSYRELARTVEAFPLAVRNAILGPSNGSGLFARPVPAALMFGAVAPDLRPNDRIALLRELANAFDSNGREFVDQIARHVPVDPSAPWDQGRSLGQEVLDELGVARDVPAPVDLDGLLRQLGVSLREIGLNDLSIRAVSIAGDAYRPTVVLNSHHRTNGYPSGRRFSIAHELCHLLFDRGHAREVALPSGPWAPRDIERRANAFAAMFLMPPGRIAAVAATISHDPTCPEFVEALSLTLQTSFSATVEHLHNLGLLSDEDRDVLRDEAVDQSGRHRPH